MATEEPTPATHNDQTALIRISRGATVMATDGPVGTVHQIIMDQRTGELQALVLASADASNLELPAMHVLRATGDAVYLDVSAADLQEQPGLAKPFNPNRYVPVRENPFLAPSEASRGAQFSERPVVTSIERDAVSVVTPPQSTHADKVIASLTTPESETYIPQPAPAPGSAENEVVGQGGSASEPTIPETHTITSSPYPPATAGDHPAEPPQPATVSETSQQAENVAAETGSELDESAANAVPSITSADSGTSSAEIADDTDGEHSDAAAGPVHATPSTEAGTDAQITSLQEDTVMEGSIPPNPGEVSDTIQDSQKAAANAFAESRQSSTQAQPPEGSSQPWQWTPPSPYAGTNGGRRSDMANRFTWIPAAALGALIVGIGAWSTVRAVRRGRRKAAKAARNARLSAGSLRDSVRDSVRGSVRDAGRSAVGVVQTMKASAQEMAANPRDTAADAFSNFSDIPARYRWFRRGMRVGAQASRFRRMRANS